MEFVTVRHPDIEGTAEVSRPAFDATYSEKGWVIVDDDAPAEPVEQPADPAPEVPEPADPAPEPAPEDVPTDTPIADGLTAEAPTPAPEV